MKRAQRLEVVQRTVDEAERRRAERLAACQRHLEESELKLRELERYHAEYARGFGLRAGAGLAGANARDYQVFLARLAEAVRQQAQIVLRARAECDAEREQWRNAAQRAHSVGRLVESWRDEDRRALDRREQRESDERAQRTPAAREPMRK